jgi:hypothetical protein
MMSGGMVMLTEVLFVLQSFFTLKNIDSKFDIHDSVHHDIIYENDQQDATV